MGISTIIFIVSLLGASIGVKNIWMGGIPGLLIVPLLIYFSISSNITLIVISTLISSLLGIACGFVCSIIFSGLKGRGHNVGQTFMSGFGAHHPGGIILSDGELKVLRDNNIRHDVITSY